MARVMVIEDSDDSWNLINGALGRSMELDRYSSVSETLKRLEDEPQYDLFLVDITLPDGEGFDLADRIQSMSRYALVPIMFLTARTNKSDELMGFTIGADDYITKPFDPIILRARVEARLKKREKIDKNRFIISHGPIKVDKTSHSVSIYEGDREVPVDLTPIEYKILALLISNPSKLFSRDEILDTIWGKDIHVYPRSVDTHVSKLRKKLGEASDYIRSVHGIGYRMSQVEEHQEREAQPQSRIAN